MHFFKKFFDAANQSAEAVNRQIIRITQRNLNAGLDLAKSLASARDPFEIAKLQASFWWKQFNEFSTQAEEVHKRLFGFGAVPEPTPEPDLKAPAQESLTSPQPEHRLAAQDPAIPRARQKPAKQKVETPMLAAQSPRAAGSEVGRSKSGRRRSTAEKSPPARQQGERKPQATRTPTRQIVRADAARPHERQSGTPKKGAPHEPAPQVLPMGVKFGMLDGNAVRFTNFEAWWLVDGAWRPISPGEVLSNAAVMREARFKEVFPQVPILPRKSLSVGSTPRIIIRVSGVFAEIPPLLPIEKQRLSRNFYVALSAHKCDKIPSISNGSKSVSATPRDKTRHKKACEYWRHTVSAIDKKKSRSWLRLRLLISAANFVGDTIDGRLTCSWGGVQEKRGIRHTLQVN